MPNERAKRIYDALSRQYDVKEDFDTFEQGLQNDPQTRRRVYDALSKAYSVKEDFATFETGLMEGFAPQGPGLVEAIGSRIQPTGGTMPQSPFAMTNAANYLGEAGLNILGLVGNSVNNAIGAARGNAPDVATAIQKDVGAFTPADFTTTPATTGPAAPVMPEGRTAGELSGAEIAQARQRATDAFADPETPYTAELKATGANLATGVATDPLNFLPLLSKLKRGPALIRRLLNRGVALEEVQKVERAVAEGGEAVAKAVDDLPEKVRGDVEGVLEANGVAAKAEAPPAQTVDEGVAVAAEEAAPAVAVAEEGPAAAAPAKKTTIPRMPDESPTSVKAPETPQNRRAPVGSELPEEPPSVQPGQAGDRAIGKSGKGSARKEPWQMTQREIVGENPQVDEFAASWNEEEFLSSGAQPKKPSDVIHETPVEEMGGMGKVKRQYAAADDAADEGRTLLVMRYTDEAGSPVNGELGQWHPAGEYRGGDLGIIESERGKGVGTAFEKHLMESGRRSGPSIGYSPSGLATVKKAHRQTVEAALARGEDVPAEVLADYPDLAKQAQRPPASPPPKKPATKQPEPHIPGERSFPKTLERADMEGGTDRLYDIASDEGALDAAAKRINDSPTAAYQFAIDESRPLSKDQVTTGVMMMRKLEGRMAKAKSAAEKAALAEQQVEIANVLSRRLTEAGQSVQAASIVNRLDPEGLVLFAQKRAAKINKTLPPRRRVRVTAKDVQELTKLSRRARSMEGMAEDAARVGEIARKFRNPASVTRDDLEYLNRFQQKLADEFGVPRSGGPPVGHKAPPKPGGAKPRTRDALAEYAAKREAEALERMKKRASNLNAGVNPQDLADLAVVGASKMVKTGVKFLDWSESMVAQFGEAVRPHLRKVFERSRSLLSSHRRKVRQATAMQRELNKLQRSLESSTEITRADLDTFQELVENVGKYTGEAREEALLQIQRFMQDLEKPGIGRRLATAQTVAQLLNPKTNVRNILGNELFYRIERLNRYVSTPIDWVASKFTGTRSITWKKGGQKGYWEGLMRGTRYGWKGINPEGLTTQFDLKGQTFRSKFNPLTYLEKAMSASLRGFDMAAYRRGFNQWLGEQAELHILNNRLTFKDAAERRKFVDDFMQNADFMLTEQAGEYGKYLTFQDENLFTKTFTGLKKIFNLGQDFGLGDFVLKYPKTPANLLYRALEYSPAGFARSISILRKPFDNPVFRQREFVQSLSRAITGTLGFTGLGSYLYSKGVLMGAGDKDWDVEKFRREQTGEAPYQVNVDAISRWVKGGFKEGDLKKRDGDNLVTYDWAQPVALSIALGADLAKEATINDVTLNNLGSLSGDIAYNSLNSALNTIVEQPLLRGVREAFGSNYNNDILRQVTRIAEEVPASFVPTLFSQIRQFTDNDGKLSYDPNPLQKALNRGIYKMPFVNKSLPKAFKTMGGDVREVYQSGSNTLFNVFFNPSFVSKYNLDPQIQMVIEPYDRERRRGQFPKAAPYTIRAGRSTLARFGIETDNAFESIRVKPEDVSEFQRRMAEATDKRFKRVDPKKLARLPMEDQEKALADMVQEAYDETKAWFFTKRAKDYFTNGE